jgi:hypothetical protein
LVNLLALKFSLVAIAAGDIPCRTKSDDSPQLKVLEELKKEQIKLRNKENLLLVDNKK